VDILQYHKVITAYKNIWIKWEAAFNGKI